MKYTFQCVGVNDGSAFIIETDELLIRGGVFTHAGRLYQIVDGPQPGVECSRVTVRRLR